MELKNAGKLLKILAIVAVIAVLFSVLPGCGAKATPTPSPTISPTPTDVPPLAAKARFRVATTTSLYDTGLWGYLEPMFEKKYNVEMDILSLGSGAAFDYGKRGDVDAITIHDKPNELKFVSDNYGVERVPFAYNYFLIVGPASDPAGIKGMTPENAFKTLFTTGKGTFISRGDNSGTQSKEKAIWAAAGYDYPTVEKAGAWYIEAGLGMGPTLQMANEKLGYTLSDMGTYLSYKSKLNLVPIVDQGAILLNVYSVIAVNPQKVTVVKNLAMANNLIAFLTSPEIQDLIGKYGVKEYGLQLFTPCFGHEPSS